MSPPGLRRSHAWGPPAHLVVRRETCVALARQTLCRVSDYFDERTVNRARLLWVIATRRQLERWEPIAAAALLADRDGRQLDDADVCSAVIEHHFALVAAAHLLVALDLPPTSSVPIDETMRAEGRRRPGPARALGRERARVQRDAARHAAEVSLGQGLRRAEPRSDSVLVDLVEPEDRRSTPPARLRSGAS